MAHLPENEDSVASGQPDFDAYSLSVYHFGAYCTACPFSIIQRPRPRTAALFPYPGLLEDYPKGPSDLLEFLVGSLEVCFYCLRNR